MKATPSLLGATLLRALREALAYSHANLYRTSGRAWREIIASLAFETKADLSLIRDLDEQDQARFRAITDAFMARELSLEALIDNYLEFFPRPVDWERID